MKNLLRNKSKSRKVFALVGGAALVVLAAIFFFVSLHKNLAQEATMQLENDLKGAGASKICTIGDGGKSMDNRTPWYTVYFESSQNFNKAEETIVEIARRNGFELQSTDSGAKRYLGDVVYVDDGKPSPYTELRQGRVEFTVALSNSGSLNACPGGIKNDAAHTAITLELRLPTYKN